MSSQLEPQERSEIREYLNERFSLDELKNLSFDLGIPYENFPHENKMQFSRELYGYCERRKIVSCLLIRINNKRNDAGRLFERFLEKLDHCAMHKKIQIYIPNGNLKIPIRRLAEEVAGLLHNTSPEDIEIIAVKPIERQVLVGLPKNTAINLLQEGIPAFELRKEKYQFGSIIDFQDLSKTHQDDWEYQVERSSHRLKAQHELEYVHSVFAEALRKVQLLSDLLREESQRHGEVYQEIAKIGGLLHEINIEEFDLGRLAESVLSSISYSNQEAYFSRINELKKWKIKLTKFMGVIDMVLDDLRY